METALPYPVKPFVKDAGIPFHKRDWIEADVSKPNNDKRFESRKIDMGSVKVIAKATYAEVREFITPFIKPSIASIENGGASLGLIKPRILGFDCRVIDTDEWDKSQVDLNGNPKGKIKLGQKSAYTFVCEETKSCSCANNPHAIDVHDWELNELYRNIIRKGKNPNLIRVKMKEKWLGWMGNRDIHFVMGTHFKYKTWMIVSVLYPSKMAEQPLTSFTNTP